MSTVLSLSKRPRLVVLGNGMATGRLLDDLASRQCLAAYDVAVFGEEPHGQYNRVLLSNVLGGRPPESILMKDSAWYSDRNVRFHRGVRAQQVDLDKRVVVGNNGVKEPFDLLVFATGSRSLLPPIAGVRCDDTLLEGVFLFRTIDDALALRGAACSGGRAVVLGGGLLGLEAAKGLAEQGMSVTVVDRGASPMSKQLDLEGGQVLGEHLEAQGIRFVGRSGVIEVVGSAKVEAVRLEDGSCLPAQILVVACGIQPRTELAVAAGIPVGRAILVDDRMRVPGLTGVFAVGECAEHRGRVYGVVAPIWEQVAAVVAQLADSASEAAFLPTQVYTRLKVAGVGAASLGELEAQEGDEVLVIRQRGERTFRRVIVRDGRVVGAQCVGDLVAVPNLVHMWQRGEPVPRNLVDLFSSDDWERGRTERADQEVCTCHRVTRGALVLAVQQGCRSLDAVGAETRAGTGCGSCRGEISRIIHDNPEAEPVPKSGAGFAEAS